MRENAFDIALLFAHEYNVHMDTLHNKYIPKEYLAVKIIYRRKRLAQAIKITQNQRKINGIKHECYCVNGRPFAVDSRQGVKLSDLYRAQQSAMVELAMLEALWNSTYMGKLPDNIEPRPIARNIAVCDYKEVRMDRNFFDSLKNDANPNYRENKRYLYDGIYYRSEAERQIAAFYTQAGISFKYEPEIRLAETMYPIYPDFVIWLEEIDCCKIHEHLGLLHSSEYLKSTKIKFGNYVNAGLLPEYDYFFTYSTPDIHFDANGIMPRINNLILNSLCCCEV